MKEQALADFHTAYEGKSAVGVARFLSPVPPAHDAGRLYDFWRCSTESKVEQDIGYALGYGQYRLPRREVDAWVDILACYWRAVDRIIKHEQAQNQGKLSERQAIEVYDAWRDLTTTFQKYIGNGPFPSWTVFTLYFVANHLRKLAINADAQLAKVKPVTFSAGFQDDIVATTAKNEKLTDASRIFNRIFALCTNDRTADLSESRKWAVYCLANLQFRTYFKLKTISLSKNLVKSIEAQADMPAFRHYPASHRVTYQYYVGVLSFVEEDYAKAEKALMDAWNTCHVQSYKNQELILTYLIPCRLITEHVVPSAQLLKDFPHLNSLFGDLVKSIKKGDLSGFDKALADGEPEFVRRRIFLTLERGRDIALRNLLRKVFLAAGYDDLKPGQTEKDKIRKTRIPLAHFAAALRMGTAGSGTGQVVEDEEVECLVANMIYKGLIKGYISREHAMVVLNKKGAFPGTGV